MSGAHVKFEGWTLAEALERTKAPGESFEHGRNGLWQNLLDERLVAAGSRGRAGETSTRIRSESWINLVVGDWDKSTVQERGTEIEIHNVRIFPILHSEDAPAHMAGRSLSDVFRRFVIEDPEVAALGKEVSRQDELHVPVFRDGRYPGHYIDFKWPLDLKADDLTFHFVKPFISYVEDPTPRASEVVKSVARVIVARLQALRTVLIQGKVIVRGTFVMTGMVGIIDPLQWRRSGLCIDIRNGDLFEEDNSKLVLRWSGLALVAPMVPTMQAVAGIPCGEGSYPHVDTPTAPGSMFHVECTAPDGIRPTTTTQDESSVTKAGKALARVETNVASYKACVAWLVQILRASPNERAETKASLWKKAQIKWPGTLSQRSFFIARAEAIRASGATAWGAAGASRKSARKSTR